MKRFLLLLASFFVLCALHPAHLAAKELTFAASSPLDSYQARVASAILSEALNRNNHTFRAQSFPSLRALAMSNAGYVDGELHRVYEFHQVSNGQYPNLVRIDSKLMTIYLSVFTTVQDAYVKDWRDLKGKDVGYLLGRQNVKTKLNEVSDSDHIFPQPKEINLFSMLASNRFKFIISESVEGQSILRSSPKFRDIYEVTRLEETYIYAYLHMKHKELAKTLATTIDKMKADGTFGKIVSKVTEEYLSGYLLTSKQK
ncbi:MAG: hypothetical protein ACNI27_08280 [Desulfovibrio sp.]